MNQPNQRGNSSKGAFASLFEQSLTKTFKEGEIIKGTVLAVRKNDVLVDIGYKSEGVIDRQEFIDIDGEISVKAGDEIEVYLESTENENGVVSLSKRRAEKSKFIKELKGVLDSGGTIRGTVTTKAKNGFGVMLPGGVMAFIPLSQFDVRPVRNMDKCIGQSYDFKVISLHPERGVLLSRKALLEQQRDALKARTLGNIEEGSTVVGIVKSIIDYGVFVDLGGIDGLLHVSDMSWGRIKHPSEMFTVGDEVTVKILKYNPETERVSLGLKQTSDDPWLTVSERYPLNSKFTGKVISVTDFGAFVELEPGLQGLIHISEMSWKKPKHPSKLLQVGQEVEVIVIEVNVSDKRISLGLKQLEADPWTTFSQKYNPGDVIRGKIRSVTDYGVFVGIEDGVDGMVHRSDLSWTQRINNPAEVYRKGDEVEAIILSVNHEEKKVSLGIKQLYEDPWTKIPTVYPVGTVLEVRVISSTNIGVFVELERGVEGLVPSTEFQSSSSEPKEGDLITCEITEVSPQERRVTLAYKGGGTTASPDAIKFAEDRVGSVPLDRKVGPSGRPPATLGEVFKNKFGAVGQNDAGQNDSEA